MTALLNAPATMTTNPNTVSILGEVVSYSLPSNVITTKAKIQAALVSAGLDPKFARGLCLRHAFVRALRKAAKDKLLRPLMESATETMFEISQEKLLDRSAKQLNLTNLITLDKGTGTITSTDPALQSIVSQEMLHATESRRTADVSRLVCTLLEKYTDLKINFARGTYFIPVKHAAFILQLEAFMVSLGGRLNRMPVADGTPQGTTTVQSIVTDALSELIVEACASGQNFSESTRNSTLDKHAKKLQSIADKIAEYERSIGTAKTVLEDSLAYAYAQLAETRRQAEASQQTENVFVRLHPSVTKEMSCPSCGEWHMVDENETEFLCADCGKPVSVCAKPNAQGGFQIAL